MVLSTNNYRRTKFVFILKDEIVQSSMDIEILYRAVGKYIFIYTKWYGKSASNVVDKFKKSYFFLLLNTVCFQWH